VSSEDATSIDSERRRSNSEAPEWVSVVEYYDDAPDECTIYPLGCPDHELVTTWITAQEGSFVDADDIR
jgi:hypothetical protein